MPIRRRVLLIVGITFIGLVAVLFAALRFVLLDSFAGIEQNDTQRNVERVLNALEQQESAMAAINADWGHWDDTYEFVLGDYPEYIEDNLAGDTLANLDLNLVLFTEPDGTIFHVDMVDLEEGEERAMSPEMESFFAESAFLYQHEDTMESLVSGIANLPEGPMMISSRPILTNEGEGPRAGVLLLGRFMDAALIADLGDQVQLDLTFGPLDDQPAVNFTDAVLLSAGGLPIVIEPQETDIVAGFAQVNDIGGEPAFLIEVDISRDIYVQGQAILQYLLLGLIVAGGGTGVVILIISERLLLRRLISLSETIESITVSKNPSQRVVVTGDDELGSLATSMNTMLATLEDSQRQLTEQAEQLRIASYKAKEAARVRSEFLANMSHELRTPLNAIIGFSDIMLMGINGSMNEKQTHQMGRLRANGERLLDLVNDILDIARIEAKRVELSPTSYSPRELIERVAAEVEPLALEKQLAFNVTIAQDIPDTLVADHKRIEQVVVNLLSNAFKFTQEGTVTLEATTDLVAQTWCITVTDTGIGIPPHARDLIFEEFRQVDGSARRAYGGTGLGLAIARNLLRIMGGQIAVDSELGQGSTFTVTLPIMLPQDDNGHAVLAVAPLSQQES